MLSGSGPIALAAVLEYLTAEVAELAGNALSGIEGQLSPSSPRPIPPKAIQPRHIGDAVFKDEELHLLFGRGSGLRTQLPMPVCAPSGPAVPCVGGGDVPGLSAECAVWSDAALEAQLAPAEAAVRALLLRWRAPGAAFKPVAAPVAAAGEGDPGGDSDGAEGFAFADVIKGVLDSFNERDMRGGEGVAAAAYEALELVAEATEEYQTRCLAHQSDAASKAKEAAAGAESVGLLTLRQPIGERWWARRHRIVMPRALRRLLAVAQALADRALQVSSSDDRIPPIPPSPRSRLPVPVRVGLCVSVPPPPPPPPPPHTRARARSRSPVPHSQSPRKPTPFFCAGCVTRARKRRC
jgi:hypothetical protein